MVALHIHGLHFSRAEGGYVPHEVFKKERVLLQVESCQETGIHYNVGSFFFICKYFNQVFLSIRWLTLLELLNFPEEQVIEILNCDLVIADTHQLLFASLHSLQELFIQFILYRLTRCSS